ncbi:hypothetical protein BGW36DRAFT_432316 [Talaromyces proteolyticus]|uniref:Uncharacterized protein n=1 Tax=Talaromyces proteolyticus TaxID=1131652 RepID=A0AAD4PTA1_9EURO|nr:uncharacterized protein BGW36DRAFT_432316 [Talaromyces proteolyticus]KAH8690516.1 hypothetical protein BGW36DRAFT_432316 [Talaromyces proteolyticus]
MKPGVAVGRAIIGGALAQLQGNRAQSAVAVTAQRRLGPANHKLPAGPPAACEWLGWALGDRSRWTRSIGAWVPGCLGASPPFLPEAATETNCSPVLVPGVSFSILVGVKLPAVVPITVGTLQWVHQATFRVLSLPVTDTAAEEA